MMLLQVPPPKQTTRTARFQKKHPAPPRQIARPPREIPRWKRPLDVALVLLSLPVLLPIAAFIALGIVAVSPGPIFFSQERVGLRGRRFKCWKYRSMKISAGDADGVHKQHTAELMRNGKPWGKMDGRDPRVIPLGRLLRATGLDELPQLFNVLMGDMSIVGPRPGTPYECAAYEPWQKERLDCLPGLTGLWQVSGKNRTTFVEMVKLDIHYVRNPSLLADVQIMFRTLPTLAGQVINVFRRNKKQPSQQPLQQELQQQLQQPTRS